jgi:hypothetical protein
MPTPATTNPTLATVPYKKLAESQWAELKGLYELGKFTKTELAAKYGISRQAIAKGLKDRGAVYGCRAGEIEEATVQAQKEATRKLQDDITAMKERQRQRVELIQGLVVKGVTDQVRKGAAIGLIKDDILVLKNAMVVVATGRQELYQIYDLTKEDSKLEEQPEFIVGEYTPDEIEALNRQRLGVLSKEIDELAQGIEDDVNLDDIES